LLKEKVIVMIVIAGMVGLGKTTLAETLSKEMGIPAYYESVKDNQILPLFYTATPEETQKQRYPFLLQLEFLRTRIRDLKSALAQPNAVMDRSIYEDPYFAKKIYEEGRISELELQIYLSLFKEMMEEVPGTPSKKPDVLIYLKASWDTVYRHLLERGRDYELGEASMKHLRFLHEGYDEWLKNDYHESPVIVLDYDKGGILDSTDVKAALLAQLQQIPAKSHRVVK
jgi:deoxyadenosine/deoxycytidine kinase